MNLISIASHGYFGLEAGGGGPVLPVFVQGPTITTELIGDMLIASKELRPMMPSIVPLVKPPIQTISEPEEPSISIDEIKPKIEVD